MNKHKNTHTNIDRRTNTETRPYEDAGKCNEHKNTELPVTCLSFCVYLLRPRSVFDTEHSGRSETEERQTLKSRYTEVKYVDCHESRLFKLCVIFFRDAERKG